jgi:hypothetical protein
VSKLAKLKCLLLELLYKFKVSQMIGEETPEGK